MWSLAAQCGVRQLSLLYRSNFSYKLQLLQYHTLNSFIKNRCGKTLLKKKIVNVPNRTYIQMLFKILRRKGTEAIRIADEVPENFKLIYRNTMERYIFASNIISCTATLLVFVVIIAKHGFEERHLTLEKVYTQPEPMDDEVHYYVAALIFFAVMLQLLVARTPVRIYNHPQSKRYTFVFNGTLPFTKKKILCQRGEVQKLEERGILPWKDCRYSIRGETRVIMLDNYFQRPADLHIMLGVQKD